MDEDRRVTESGRRSEDVPLQVYLETYFKGAMADAMTDTRHAMRNEFAAVAAAVQAANITNAAAHAASDVKLDNLVKKVDDLGKMEPRLATVEAEQKAESAVAAAVDKMRDWNLRLVVGMAAIGGLAIAFAH